MLEAVDIGHSVDHGRSDRWPNSGHGEQPTRTGIFAGKLLELSINPFETTHDNFPSNLRLCCLRSHAIREIILSSNRLSR